jgi:hypothetical protein
MSITSKDLDEQFLEYCNSGNLEGIKELLESQKPVKKKSFLSFLNLFQSAPPKFSFFTDMQNGFLKLCENGNTEIVGYLINHPMFKSEVMANHGGIPSDNEYFNNIANGFFIAAKNRHLDCANLLSSYVNQCENSFGKTFHEFLEACSSGNLPYVEFLSTHEDTAHVITTVVNYKLDEFRPTNEAFIAACENGHLNVVKYLTSDPHLQERVNPGFVDQDIFITITNIEIIQHFIFDLNLPKNHRIFSVINSISEDTVEKLLEKRDLFQNLEKSLEQNNSKDSKPRSRKI